jgi:hypothetical protein
MTADDGLRLEPDSPCVDAADGNVAPSTDVLGLARIDIPDVNSGAGDPNYVDMGAYEVGGRVLNTTQHHYHQTIQEALDDAEDSDVVKVYPGTYEEKTDFSGVSCTLMSSDPNDPAIVASTVIDANGQDWAVKLDANAVLDGVTVTGAGQYKYGIYYTGSSSPTVTNCRIIDNDGWGLVSLSGSPTICNCTFERNTLHGLQLQGPSQTPHVYRCTIIDNNASGVYITTNCLATLENCIIARNSNHGVMSGSASARVINCTIVDNTQDGINGGCGEVKNCIVWDNGDDLDGSQATYSCVKDEDTGLGNFSINPRFKEPDGNDFKLDNWSRCIDWGDPNSDYSNEPAPNGARINVGAHGNTENAATFADENDDGLPEGWLEYYWPGYDPNDPNYGPGGNPDVDDFNNLVEYLFGYEPNVATSKDMELIVGLSGSPFDPTQSETMDIIYLLNMDANVVIAFTDADTSESVRTISREVSAGRTEESWDGKDGTGLIVEDGFYEMTIDANDGDGNSTSFGPVNVEVYYVHDITNLVCNPYRILPLNNEVSKITYDLTTDANMVVTVYDPCGVLFTTLIDDVQQTVASNPQELTWYGRDKDPSDSESRYIAKEGAYLVRVRFVGMREKEETTVRAFK